ncbi:MAG: hypothetical protein P8X42_04255 [Calditrichaceae bacterium]|jgi:signal transduction histidine kinase
MIYGIIKQSRGNILVQSEINNGTAFNICLPSVNKKIGNKKDDFIDVKNQNGERNDFIGRR